MNLIIPALDLPRAPAISATSTLTGFGFLNITATHMSEENTANNLRDCFLISNLTIFSRVAPLDERRVCGKAGRRRAPPAD